LKRLPAILFLLILVFNFVGYRLVIAYMEKGSDAVLEKKLDHREYSDDELLSIKTGLNLPYYSSSPEFERTYGSITINGLVYEYVKKRVYNDTLELLCLPNAAKTALQDVRNALTKSAADGQASLPLKKGPSTVKITLPDFFQELSAFPASPVFYCSIAYPQQNEAYPISVFSKRPERPPQTMLFVS
jgi:hypothetical protein